MGKSTRNGKSPFLMAMLVHQRVKLMGKSTINGKSPCFQRNSNYERTISNNYSSNVANSQRRPLKLWSTHLRKSNNSVMGFSIATQLCTETLDDFDHQVLLSRSRCTIPSGPVAESLEPQDSCAQHKALPKQTACICTWAMLPLVTCGHPTNIYQAKTLARLAWLNSLGRLQGQQSTHLAVTTSLLSAAFS